MELDALFPEINPGDYIQFLRTTFVKLWEFISGEKRVEDEKKRGKLKDRILYRTRLPKVCKGMYENVSKIKLVVIDINWLLFIDRDFSAVRTLGYSRTRINWNPSCQYIS